MQRPRAFAELTKQPTYDHKDNLASGRHRGRRRWRRRLGPLRPAAVVRALVEIAPAAICCADRIPAWPVAERGLGQRLRCAAIMPLACAASVVTLHCNWRWQAAGELRALISIALSAGSKRDEFASTQRNLINLRGSTACTPPRIRMLDQPGVAALGTITCQPLCGQLLPGRYRRQRRQRGR